MIKVTCEECHSQYEAEPQGGHRLLCGDATNAQDVERLVHGESVEMIWTDPPYGIALDTDWSGRIGATGYGKRYVSVTGDADAFDFGRVQRPACREQFWWGADYYRATLPDGGSWYVWDKRAESQDSMVGARFELCWSATSHSREIIREPWVGYVAHDPGESRTHPTQKPVAVAGWFVERFASPGEIVWDGFAGSGTTLIAAEQLGRRCFAMEIEPAYCDVIVRRWEHVTGKKAIKA